MTDLDSDCDYYRLLGVPRDATTPEIRRAYRRLARQHHPDRNPHPDSPARFGELADAYAAINDPARRARYDHIIHAPGPSQAPRRSPSVPSWLPTFVRGTLELSTSEAQLAAVSPLELAGLRGIAILLPAGVRDGDHIVTHVGNSTIVLAVRVNPSHLTDGD